MRFQISESLRNTTLSKIINIEKDQMQMLARIKYTKPRKIGSINLSLITE